ncbi:putative C6 transcription factor Prf [Sphaerosporella brunnea]|uniref:Putative C6 transcription factor Prf n=1 Tax=Sphaerosporella brunnea TaxID=1250544 RepID=A0A5J5EEL8_9PEZI|nr:putative C6 transcription factor Prf [Sphaerosporella brunnea]
MASTQSRSAPSSSPSKLSGIPSLHSGPSNDGAETQKQSRPPNVPTPEVPRPKRIACVVCRKRKLRCDGAKPSCGTCARLGHDCAYDEIRRKSGPKRGYVKALEARLAQVETLLKDQTASPPEYVSIDRIRQPPYGSQILVDPPLFGDVDVGMEGIESLLGKQGSSVSPNQQAHSSFDSSPMMDISRHWPNPTPDISAMEPTSSWGMLAMGFEEALPAPDIVDALHTIYFEKLHPCMPIIHKARYFASLSMAPNLRPPVALRYAIWTLAASVSDEHSSLQTHLYRKARKYLEDSEMKGHGEGIISVASSQAWLLITTYEFKLMYFPRAWMSTGRAVRLAQMMGLHRLDGSGLEVKQCLPAPKDWIEREERRRTFWLAFCLDRYASIGTGWPMTIDERDILTNFPVTEDSFERGRPAKTMTLKEAMTANGASLLSPFGGVCLMASLFGRNLTHLHRSDADEKDDDLNGEFWRRHRNMDNILLNIQLSLPSHFRLPAGIQEANIVFTNMNIHTSTICLHQAAIFKAEKNRMPSSVSAESKIRCITAAAQIASIMRMVCHLDLSGMNPFVSFCLYVAARVFVQYLKSRPGDEQVRASLQFLLTAMGHMKKKNPLTESFLVQLDVDLTGTLDGGGVNRFPYSFRSGQSEMPPEKTYNDYPTPHPVQEIPIEELPFMAAPGAGGRPNASGPAVHSRMHSEGSVDKPASEGFPGLSPQNSQNRGQSPASLDMSENSGNFSTPPSQNNPPSSSSYSPPQFFNEYSSIPIGIDGMDSVSYSQLPKDVDWSALANFDEPDLEMTAMGGATGMMVSPELNEFFTESSPT